MGLLTWVGGKSREAKLIISYFPRKEDVDVYFEPFDQLTFFNRCIKNTQSRWLVTNSGTSFIRDLYKDFTIIDLPASRVVGPKHSRKKVNDIIIKNY